MGWVLCRREHMPSHRATHGHGGDSHAAQVCWCVWFSNGGTVLQVASGQQVGEMGCHKQVLTLALHGVLLSPFPIVGNAGLPLSSRPPWCLCWPWGRGCSCATCTTCLHCSSTPTSAWASQVSLWEVVPFISVCTGGCVLCGKVGCPSVLVCMCKAGALPWWRDPGGLRLHLC